MDPLLPTDPEVVEREEDKEDARRKIQFSVPSAVPLQLDPRQVEMIRRRRPTPATLFRLTDQSSPEEDGSPHQWVLGENGALKAKLVHMSTYQPPSLKAVQMMAQAHLSSLDKKTADKDELSSGEEEEQREDEKQQRLSARSSREESKPIGDPCDQLSNSTAKAEISRCHGDHEKPTEWEDGKGE
uniref:Protein phosphatase 1 regulatory subunit 1B n=1 Tax=Nothobranchius rachovii TaxID=451742 RepID=A0A1A8PD82_9TELE